MRVGRYGWTTLSQEMTTAEAVVASAVDAAEALVIAVDSVAVEGTAVMEDAVAEGCVFLSHRTIDVADFVTVPGTWW